MHFASRGSETATAGSRCQPCVNGRLWCSLIAKETGSSKDVALESSSEHTKMVNPVLPERSKSPGIIKTITKSLHHKSEPKEPVPSTLPPVPSMSTHGSHRTQQVVEVLLPCKSASSFSIHSTSPFEFDDPPALPPPSPYSSIAPGLPSQLTASYSTSSFALLTPATDDYRYELERLQIQFCASHSV